LAASDWQLAIRSARSARATVGRNRRTLRNWTEENALEQDASQFGVVIKPRIIGR
jgi:hypothetical protein